MIVLTLDSPACKLDASSLVVVAVEPSGIRLAMGHELP